MTKDMTSPNGLVDRLLDCLHPTLDRSNALVIAVDGKRAVLGVERTKKVVTRHEFAAVLEAVEALANLSDDNFREFEAALEIRMLEEALHEGDESDD